MRYTILFVIWLWPGFFSAGIRALDRETGDPLADLLRANFEGSKFTALVEYERIRIREVIGGYAFMEHDCRVIRVYRGKTEERFVFYHQVDREFAGKILKKKRGKRFIVSLDIDPENGRYFMGDNGYEIPAHPRYLRLAENLAKMSGQGK